MHHSLGAEFENVLWFSVKGFIVQCDFPLKTTLFALLEALIEKIYWLDYIMRGNDVGTVAFLQVPMLVTPITNLEVFISKHGIRSKLLAPFGYELTIPTEVKR